MSRLRFACLLALALATGLLFAADAPIAAARIPRGGKFEWARLRTAEPYWERHGDIDRKVMDLIRDSTGLNLSIQWQYATAKSLADLTHYPFIIVKDLGPLSPEERRNFGEYLKRGGFMLIDACRNPGANPDIRGFYRSQLAALQKEFPDLRVGVLQPDHPVFSVFFKMRAFPPCRPQFVEPMFGMFSGDRMIGMMGLTGFLCAAQGIDGIEIGKESAEMIANVYIYALTR